MPPLSLLQTAAHCASSAASPGSRVRPARFAAAGPIMAVTAAHTSASAGVPHTRNRSSGRRSDTMRAAAANDSAGQRFESPRAAPGRSAT